MQQLLPMISDVSEGKGVEWGRVNMHALTGRRANRN